MAKEGGSAGLTRPLRHAARCALALALAAALGCAAPRPPEADPRHDPAAAAMGVVRLARDVDANADAIAALFEPGDDLDHRAALFDALAALRDVTTVDVAGVEPLDAVGRVAVDLTVGLGDGATAGWTIQFARRDDGTLHAVWFAGPGVEWPRRARRDSGLSTSPPPG